MLTFIENDLSRSTAKRKFAFYMCTCGASISKRKDKQAEFCSGPLCTFSKFKRHGKSDTRLYNIWSGIRDRCINGNHTSAATYKDKGITVCKEWDLFSNFEEWALSNGYEDHLTIDRIKIEKGYSPDNCEWVTRSENTKRQVRDYHSNHRAVKAFNDSTELVFKSVVDCAKYIIDNRFSKSTKIDSVASIISGIVNESYKTNKAYGFYFGEAK